MSMQPIQIPFRQKLREFRTRFVPVITFVVVLVIVISLWGNKTQQSSFVGKVVADTAYVSAPLTGQVQGFTLQEFDVVQAGDVIATVAVADSAMLQAKLDVFRTQIELMKATQEPISDLQRNRIDLISLQLDVINETIEFESLNIRRIQLLRTTERMTELFEKNLISAQELEDSTLELSLVTSAYEAKKSLIADMEREMQRLVKYESGSSSASDPVTLGISALEAEMEEAYQEFKPTVLIAPISGTVVKVFVQNGAYLNGGVPLVLIASPTPTHIIGYIRQPISIKPHIGMIVQIRTRTYPKQIAEAVIDRTGAQIMIYDANLQRGSGFIESGIPVRISLDGLGHLDLIPGEIVDVLVMNP